MVTNFYTIYDSKVKAYLPPWQAQNHATAFRNLELACRKPDAPFVQFPGDYHVFCVGTWDEQSGAITPHAVPESLGNMFQFLPVQEASDGKKA